MHEIARTSLSTSTTEISGVEQDNLPRTEAKLDFDWIRVYFARYWAPHARESFAGRSSLILWNVSGGRVQNLGLMGQQKPTPLDV